MVKYVYDAWGNHAVVDSNGEDIDDMTNIGNMNPFRYNGYYYDVETGFYYLKTRYYDPELGRFISQDSIEYANPETINGLNLFAYCANNPVMYFDPTGKSKIGNWFKNLGKKIKNAFKTVWHGISTAFNAVVDFFKDYGAVIGTGFAAIGGLVVCTVASIFLPGLLGSVVFSTGVGFFAGVVENMHSQISTNGYKNFDYKKAFLSGGIGAVIGAGSGVLSYAFGQVLAGFGESFGSALGNTTIKGFQVGKIFSFLGGSQTFSTLGNFLGGLIGGIAGGAFGNKYMNNLFNRNPNSGQNMYEGISGSILDYFIKFFRWMIRF